MQDVLYIFFFFFFNDTATTEIYTLSLHDALPISAVMSPKIQDKGVELKSDRLKNKRIGLDRKSTRLNSSHLVISYAVFCLKKKKKKQIKRYSKLPTAYTTPLHHTQRCTQTR